MLFTAYERMWDWKQLSEILKREMNAWGPAFDGFPGISSNSHVVDEEAFKACQAGRRHTRSSIGSQFRDVRGKIRNHARGHGPIDAGKAARVLPRQSTMAS